MVTVLTMLSCTVCQSGCVLILIVLLSAHPSTNDALDCLLQKYAGAKEVKKKEFKMKPKKASKHDFIEPGKAKVKKVCVSLSVCLLARSHCVAQCGRAR